MNKDSLPQISGVALDNLTLPTFERHQQKLRQRINADITEASRAFLEVQDLVESRKLGKYQIALEEAACNAFHYKFTSILNTYLNDLIKLQKIKGDHDE